MPRRKGALLSSLVAVLTALGGEPAQAAPPPSERSALVVGISKYAGRTKPTVGGAGDAADFREALRRAGWRDDQMMVLTDGAATAAGIRTGLRWLRERSGDSSFSVFHYSGHVKLQGRDRDRDGEALDEYLWPHDNRFISDRELADQLRGVRGRLWVDIAGCEAAGFDDGLSGPSRLFTASSGETEKSYERPDWANSVFTGLMVDQGMLQGRADADRNRHVSIQEAFRLAAREAPGMTARQKKGPQHPFIAGGDGSDWFLQPPPPPPPPPAARPPSRPCLLGVCV